MFAPILFLIAFFFNVFFFMAIGSAQTEEKLYGMCVKDNPTIEVGKIEAYCNDRLYLKK